MNRSRVHTMFIYLLILKSFFMVGMLARTEDEDSDSSDALLIDESTPEYSMTLPMN